jgi:hypothetical protein
MTSGFIMDMSLRPACLKYDRKSHDYKYFGGGGLGDYFIAGRVICHYMIQFFIKFLSAIFLAACIAE